MAHEVFISHSSLDKPVADAVCAALENTAIRCWIAPRDLQPGLSFAGEITRAIEHSKVVVLVFSAYSNASEQVLREVQLAANSHLHIVQFRIEDVVPNDDLEYYLSTPHWLDALSPPLEANLQRLQTSVKALLEMAAEDPAKRATESQPTIPPIGSISSIPASKKPEVSPSKLKWIVTTGAIVMAVVAITIGLFLIAPHPNQGTASEQSQGASPTLEPARNTERQALLTSLNGRLETLATTLNRIRTGSPPPEGFYNGNDLVPLTAIFEDIAIARPKLEETDYELLIKKARLALDLANAQSDEEFRRIEVDWLQVSKQIAKAARSK